MASYNDSMVLIVKPEQSGKTFQMLDLIKRHYNEAEEGVRTINFIFCDNSLLLTSQTAGRIDGELEELRVADTDNEGNDNIHIEFSSSLKTRYRTVADVFYVITCKPYVNNVVCCTNETRVREVCECVIPDLVARCRDNFRFNIWLDEADKAMSFIDSTFVPLLEEGTIDTTLYLLTATPGNIFNRYKDVKVLPIENPTISSYIGWEDLGEMGSIRVFRSALKVEGFIDKILRENRELLVPGTKWFVPSKFTKKSHYAVRDMCVEYGMAMMVVNGDGIEITLPTEEVFREKKDGVFAEDLVAFYDKYNLARYPFGITGKICVERGVTITSSRFMFDYAILSETANKAGVSQLAGRVKGNIRNLPNFSPTTVFTTEKFNKIATELEKKSRTVGRLAWDKDKNEPSTITLHEYKTAGEDYEHIVHPVLFSSIAACKRFLNSKKREMGVRSVNPRNATHKTPGGYLVSSTVFGRAEGMEDEDRVIMGSGNEPAPGAFISSNKGRHYLILPVYETADTPPRKAKYQVRYISFRRRNATGEVACAGAGAGAGASAGM